MATKKKMLQAAAGNATGGAGLDVEDVFSTYLYEGNGSTQTITNGIDLDGEGGLVWIKKRNASKNHGLMDTEQGLSSGNSRYLKSNTTDAQATGGLITAYNSNGFTTGAADMTNGSGEDYTSWTFRKAPKFFDVVTYTGNGSNQTISHDLSSAPGMIIVKDLDTGGNWRIYHRSLGNTFGMDFSTQAKDDDVYWNDTTPTDTVFTVGPKGDTNANGTNYVAYLFAHNDGDGDFGADGDADIIKCGSYTGNGSTDGPFQDLGFEPQWVIIKNTDLGSEQWHIFDNLRGVVTGGADQRLEASRNVAEAAGDSVDFAATGFYPKTVDDKTNGSGHSYIYIAIRRGTKVPESATEVFAIDTPSNTTPVFVSGFTPDMGFWRYTASTNTQIMSRITGQGRMYTNLTNASSNSSSTSWDYQNGWFNDTSIYGQSAYSWMWKRAPGFFDAVAYSGNSTAGHTVSHNLGVVPEMMWVKCRTKDEDWSVYHEGLGSPPEENYIYLNHDRVKNFDGNTIKWWNHTAPTDSVFTLGIESRVNLSTHDYIAYLFASLPGISKVGSFTHSNGSNTTVDCGFTSGARFVLVKQTDLADNWFVFDTERGITVSDSPRLFLNTTDDEFSASYIEPNNSGFIIKNGFWSAGDYIFYAIA